MFASLIGDSREQCYSIARLFVGPAVGKEKEKLLLTLNTYA